MFFLGMDPPPLCATILSVLTEPALLYLGPAYSGSDDTIGGLGDGTRTSEMYRVGTNLTDVT